MRLLFRRSFRFLLLSRTLALAFADTYVGWVWAIGVDARGDDVEAQIDSEISGRADDVEARGDDVEAQGDSEISGRATDDAIDHGCDSVFRGLPWDWCLTVIANVLMDIAALDLRLSDLFLLVAWIRRFGCRFLGPCFRGLLNAPACAGLRDFGVWAWAFEYGHGHGHGHMNWVCDSIRKYPSLEQGADVAHCLAERPCGGRVPLVGYPNTLEQSNWVGLTNRKEREFLRGGGGPNWTHPPRRLPRAYSGLGIVSCMWSNWSKEGFPSWFT